MKGLMKGLKWLDEHFEEACMMILLVILSCVMMTQVIARYVFNASMSWPEEACRYIWIVTVALSIGYVVKKKSALTVEIVIGLLPASTQKVLQSIIDLGMIVLHAFMTYFAGVTMNAIRVSGQLSPAMRMPMWFLYAALTIGFALGTIRYIQTLIENVKGGRQA